MGVHLDFAGAQLRLKQLHCGLYQSAQVDGRFLPGRLPREAEQAGDQRLGAARLVSDFVRQGALFLVQWRACQQVSISKHSGERIIQFMGCSTYQLTQRSQLLRLHQLRLQPF